MPTCWRGRVENLVSNAIKYSPAGTEVTVSVRAEPGGVAIEVSRPRARAFRPRDLDRIFEKFYRVPRVEDADTPGTGLGPGAGARDRRIARRHRHRDQRGGRRVDVYIANSSRAGSGSAAYMETPMGNLKVASMSKTPHILVADDERSIRLMLETGLTLNGFRVTAGAHRAGSAGPSPGAAVSMPCSAMSTCPMAAGWNWCAALRVEYPNMPIILMTAQGSRRSGGGSGGRAAPAISSASRSRFRPWWTAAPLLDARREADDAARSESRDARPFALRTGGPQRAHGDGLQADRAGGAHRCHRADHGRIGHRQGTGGARHPRFQPRAPRGPSSR